MLGALRSKKNNPVIVLLLGFVVVLMAGFGVTISGAGSGNWAARVEGETIAYPDYARAYSQAFKARQRRDRGYDRKRAEAEDLRGQVMDQLVGTKLLAMEARQRGLRVDDEALRDAIFAIEGFNQDGRFDPDTYERALRANGTNPIAFEAELREDLLANQLRAVVQGVGPSDAELKRQWRLDETKVNVHFVKIPASAFEVQVGTVTQDDVDAWRDETDDPEAAVLDFYKANKASRYDVPKQVCARHILGRADKGTPPDVRAKAREKVVEAAKKVGDGEMSFADAARAYSDDSSKTKGGDLGCFGPGQMVPRFEEAAYAMTAGETSDLIETRFGFHVIQVYEVKAPIRRKLEEVKGEIERELAESEKAKRLARDHAEAVLAAAKAEGGLEAGIEKVGEGRPEDAPPLPRLTVEESGDFARTTRFIPKLGPAGEVGRAAWALTEAAPLADAPVASEDGWVLLELASRTTPDEDAFAEAKKPLAYRLTIEKQGEVFERLVEDLEAKHAVEINPLAVTYDDELRSRGLRR